MLSNPIPQHPSIHCPAQRFQSCVGQWILSFLLLCLLPLSGRAQVDAEAVTLMGRNALSVDDYLTAIRYFNQAIEAKPYLARPYYYRAYAKFTLEDYLGAEADCTKSIDLNPFLVDVYELRGLCRIHNEDYSGAVDDYTRALREMPDEQGTRYNRALCHLQLKHYDKAEADLDYLLRRKPNFYRSYMVKAQIALERGDTLLGIARMDTVLTFNPAEGNAWAFKGRYALQKNEFERADSFLTRAINAQPADHELYVARAQTRHELGFFDLALEDYDQAIELIPQHFVAHYNRGLLRSFTGDYNHALEDFDFVLNVEPDNTLARYNRAQLRAQTGDYRGAAADYTALIKVYPNFYYGYLARAECRRKLGDVSGAASDETIVARHELDLAFGKKKKTQTRKVRLRSDHALENYAQLIEEEPDSARNVFGTLYGKVQNQAVNAEFLPMYALAFRPVFPHGYHSIGYSPELSRLTEADAALRKFCLTAAADATAATDAEADFVRLHPLLETLPESHAALYLSSIYAAQYDYTAALHEVNRAVQTDSVSAVPRMQRASILARSVAASTLDAPEAKANLALAAADLSLAAHVAPQNAYVAYNQGCLCAQQKLWRPALEAFNHAIQLDPDLPEAYYNRALVHARLGQTAESKADFSRAGQLGLYKAYAQLKAIKAKN